MATDSTHLLPGNTGIEADTGMAAGDQELGSVQLAAAVGDAPVPVNIPRGQQIIVVRVQPGQAIELPTDSPDGLLAKLGADGNLAIVVDGRTIILQGYAAANEQAPVTIVTNDGDVVDIVEVLAGTLPDLDIQTAAGPAAAGAQAGAATDAAGSGIFVPFAVGPLLGGINAEGVLGATKLQYKLIDDEREEFPVEEEEEPDGVPGGVEISPVVLDEDGLPGGNAGGPNDEPDPATKSASGNVIADFGPDGPRALDPYLMTNVVNGSQSGLFALSGGADPTQPGAPILLLLDPPAGGFQVLHGLVGQTEYFRITLNTTTGAFEVEQIRPLFHPDENNTEDNVSLNVDFVGFDANDDPTSTGTLNASFDDDSPVVTAGSGSIVLRVDESQIDFAGKAPPLFDFDDTNFPNDGIQDGFYFENDETFAVMPAALTAIGPAIGAGVANAAVLFSAQYGADGAAAADAAVYSLTILNAATGLTDTKTQQAITLHDNAGVIEGRNNDGDVVFALTIDPVTGQVSMAQYRAIDHGDEEPFPGAHDEALFLGSGHLAATLTVTDGDGDQASLDVDIGESIGIEDDGPVFRYVDFGDDQDSDGKLFGLIDEDALPDGIGDAAPGDGPGGTVVDGAINFDFGSDIPGTLSIDDLKVTDSSGAVIALGDLQTSDGRDITIDKSVDPVTGIITWAAVVAAGETGAGDAVFTFTLDGAGTGIGDFKFELHQALEHPYTDADLKNDGPDTTYEDDLRFDFTVIGTDGDGDEATGHINILVDDDSPTIAQLDAAVSLAVDETVAAEGTGDVDDPDFIFPQDGTREEDDEHLETLPAVLTNIGAVIGAATDDASKLFSFDFGADGGATTGDAVFDLKIVDTNTGLTDTQSGDPIVLVEENGVILGVADDGDANTEDPVVFALTIDPDTGALSMAQYRAVHHGDQEGEGGAFDEIVSLGAEKLAVTLTVTDADGDSVSAQRDIGNDISFDDDGPSFVNVEFGEDGDSSGGIGIIDEDELPTGNKDSAAGDGPGGTIVDGVINFDFGSDGPLDGFPGAISLTALDYTITDSAGNPIAPLALKTVDGQSLVIITSFVGGFWAVEAQILAGPDAGDPVFRFRIDAEGAGTGEFTFELFRALEHPYTDEDFNNDGKDSNGDPQTAYEDNLVFDFRVVATDGDGDEAEGHIKIDVDDDSPVVTEASGSFLLAVDETIAPNGTGDVDDPNYDGPILDGTREEDDETIETLPASLTGIGAAIGAATADASVLFDVDFGADGGAAVGDEVYSLTILDGNTGLKDTQTGQLITLVDVGGGVIEGQIAGGVEVFALTVDPSTGLVSMAQYRAIDHGEQEGEGGAFDEVLSLGSGKLAVTLTAADADGDQDSESVDIGSSISFEDDGPTFDETDFDQEDGDASGGIGLIDEDALSGGIAGGPGDDEGGDQTDGIIKFDFGSDKAGSLSIDGLKITDSAGVEILLADLKTADGTPVQTKTSAPDGNGVVTYEGYIPDGIGTITVFTLTLDTEGANIGAFEFKLEQPLQHPYTDPDFANDGPEIEYEDNLLFDFTIIGADGDGDEATGHIQISVDDDSPDVTPTTGTINLAVDETLGGGADVPGGGTRAENDETLVVLPAALTSIGAVIGAATAEASGLFTANFGADGGASTGDEVFAFKILDANTGLKDTATGDPIVLVNNGGVIEGRADDGDPNTADPVVFALAIDGDGTISMAQYRAINHGDEELAPGEHDEVIPLGGGKLAVTLTVTDADGDQDTETADIGRAITFDDDGPTAPTFTTNTVDVVHDETAGIQNGGAGDLDGDDVAGADIAFDGKTVASLFSSLTGGDDPDVGDNPIGYARSGSALVTPTGGSGGSDGIASTSHTLKVTDNTFSGVSTTEGTDIFLYQVSPTLIVGRVGTDGAPDTANPAGAIAFAIAIDPVTGEVFTAQYLSLNHPTFPDNYDEPVSLIDGAVQVTVTITDKDGDEASASDNVGNQIVFEDDGPTAPTFTTNTIDVVHDETAGIQNGGVDDLDGDDVAGGDIAFGATKVEDLFSSLVGTGDDPHVTGSTIGYARSGSALVTPAGGAAGSDGEASAAYSLKVSSAGADSGVSTTEGTQVFLYKEGDLIVGRVGVEAGAVDTPDDAGTIAFAIAIDPVTGEVFTVQYLSLNHPTFPDNHDEPVSLTDGAVQVTVTITDKDGDKASASDNVGSQIVFEDDGPTLTIGSSTQGTGGLAIELDETEGTDSAAPGEVADGNTDDTGPGLGQRTSTVPGGLKALFLVGGSSGSDGPGALTDSLKFIGIPELGLLTDLEATDGGAITLFANGDTVIEGKDGDGDIVFTIAIVDAGGGVFQLQTTLFEAIEHSDNTKFDENVVLTLDDGLVQLQYEATRTDLDGDSITESAELNLISEETSYFSFDDDGPRYISPDTLHLENKGVIGTTDQVIANLNFVAGSDGVGTVVFNVPNVPVGETEGVTVIATDGAANQLKVGGQLLYLYYGGIDGTDTTILVAKTLGGVVGFTIDIDPTTGTYIFNQEAPISNGTEVSATNLTGVGAGNVPFKLLINVGGTQQDVAMTTVNGETVNSNVDTIGIGGGQRFTVGEAVRFDLVNGLTLVEFGGNTPDEFDYDGTHNLTNRWTQLIQIDAANDEASIIVSAIVDNDGDESFFSDPDDNRIDLDETNINIYDESGQLIDPSDYVANGITVNDNGDKSVTITGLEDGWKYEIITVGDANKFNAIKVEAATGSDSFALGFFSYGENSAGTSIDLSYPVDATDGDGDKTTGEIDVSLYPDATSSSGAGFVGTAANETFLGNQDGNTISGAGGNDLLAGNGGNDTISGGIGNDTIIGGAGADILDGGDGNDVFVYETLVDGGDTIANFNTAAGGDKLDVKEVLDHDGNTWDDTVTGTPAAAIAGGYITFTDAGGGDVQVNVDIDGAGTAYASTAVAIITGVTVANAPTALEDNIVVN